MTKEIGDGIVQTEPADLIKVRSGPFLYEATETDAYIFKQKLYETEVGMEQIHSTHLYDLDRAITKELTARALIGEDNEPTEQFKKRLDAVEGGQRAYMFGEGGISMRMEEIIELAISKMPMIPREDIWGSCGIFPDNFNPETFDWNEIKLRDIARITGLNYEYWKITIDGIPENYQSLKALIYEQIEETWPFSEIDYVIYRPNEETELINEFGYS